MNPIPNNLFPLLLNLSSPKVVDLDSRLPDGPARKASPADAQPCPVKRQARTGSVIADRAGSALEAANDADARPVQAEGATEAAHYGHACHARRFQAWLHGSGVLDAPLPARCQDSPEHQAEALACQRRAVREASYVPSRTPLLFM